MSDCTAHTADLEDKENNVPAVLLLVGLMGAGKTNAGGNKGTPLDELEVGAEMQGTVKAVTNYGAFLDIGAATDALCHVSRLLDDFVSDVNDVVSVGDAVTVRIINVDTEKGQVAVTMRSEEAEANAAARGRGGGGRSKDRPRRSNDDREAQRTAMASLAETGYDEDAFVEGEVQSTLDFGTFVRFSIGDLGEGLEGEIDGLVHISVLTEGRVNQVTRCCPRNQRRKTNQPLRRTRRTTTPFWRRRRP